VFRNPSVGSQADSGEATEKRITSVAGSIRTVQGSHRLHGRD